MIDILIPTKDKNEKKLTTSEMLNTIQSYIQNNSIKNKTVGFSKDPIFNKNTSAVLIKLAQYKIIPIVETSLEKIEPSSLFINSIINLFNECYKGIGEFRIFIKSTSEKDRHKIAKSILSLTDLSNIFEKCPKLKKNKIILILDPNKNQDIQKLANLFSTEQFIIDFNDIPNQELLKDVKKYHFEIYKKENNNE